MNSGGRRLGAEEEEAIRRETRRICARSIAISTRRSRFMVESGGADTIRVQRMKKRKLALKDRIARLEDRLLPDIIA